MRGKRVVYRDMVLGPVSFLDEEAELLECAEMARLKEIKQLSTVYLFHPYAWHTRYHHSVGVAHWVKFFLGTLPLEELKALNHENMFALVAAGMLHDIGHSAWSHVGEEFVKCRGVKIKHEARSAELILDDEHKYDKYFTKWPGLKRVRDLLKRPLREKIANLINGNPPISKTTLAGLPSDKADEKARKITRSQGWMGALIHGTFDLDTADYLTRDAFFTIMSTQALVDEANYVEKVGLVPVRDKKQLAFLDLPFAESFITARELMYSGVYWESRNLVAEELLIRAIGRVFPEGEDLDNFWFSVDDEVLSRMRNSKDAFVRRVVSLMRQGETYRIVLDVPLNSERLSKLQRETIESLHDSRELLSFAEDAVHRECEEQGISVNRDSFVIGVWMWRPVALSEALTRYGGKLGTLAGVSQLLESLQTERYVYSRSKLLVAVDKDVDEKTAKALAEIVLSVLEKRDFAKERSAGRLP